MADWFNEAQRLWKEKERNWKLAAEQNLSLDLPLRDSMHTAPGWRDLGMEFTCVPDPMYPWDPAVVKAIWEFDPTFVPIWLRWVYLAPADTASGFREVVFGRHAIGRYVQDPHGLLEPFPCDMPTMPCQGLTFPRPNLIERFWAGERTGDLPGVFLPFDWSLWKFCRLSYLADASAKEIYQKTVEADRQEELQRRASIMDDMAYRARDIEKYVAKKTEQISDVEMKEYLLGKLTQ